MKQYFSLNRYTAQMLAVSVAVVVGVALGWLDPAAAGALAFVGMAAPADYLDAKDLRDVSAGGLIREDVMQEIFDCSEVPTVFLDAVGTDTCKSDYTEWTEDELAAPNTSNAAVSGSDAPATPTTAGNAARVGNRTQISTKYVYVTQRTENVDTVAIGNTLAYKTMQKMQELRRDVEAICLTGQASVADDNNTTPGRSGGLAAWIKTHADSPGDATDGGFNTTTKLVVAYTPGTRRALTWAMIAAQIQGVYQEGSNPTLLMSVPDVTKRIAQYLFTTQYAAAPTANVSGTAPAAQVSQGYIDTFRTDFGFTMQIVPNRLQQLYEDDGSDDAAHVFGIDTDYVAVAYLQNYKVDPLAKLGLSIRRQLSVDWTLKPYLERAHFRISDVNPTAAVTAGS